MGRPLPLRGITGHLVLGEDGAAWACYEVEPFPYPHRSVRDAREVQARTAAALLGLPTHSLVLSAAYAVSASELETRISGRTNPGSAAGWAAAEQAAVEAGIALVRGMEISTRTAGRSVHLLAYLVDPEHPDLVARLAGIVAGRDDRIPAMLRALAAQGMELDPEDMLPFASTRPHALAAYSVGPLLFSWCR